LIQIVKIVISPVPRRRTLVGGFTCGRRVISGAPLEGLKYDRRVQSWPSAPDIAAQAIVGFQGSFGSGRRALETALMTRTGYSSPDMHLIFRSSRLKP